MHTLDGVSAVRLAAARSGIARFKLDGHDRVGDKHIRGVLATHLPNHDGTSCAACDFVYTSKFPLCPSVAGALRELSSGDPRAPQQKSSLADYSTDRLRSLAREHCGEGRCRRCGFVYAGEVRRCPTSRRIANELEARAKTPLTQAPAGQGLCVGKGAGWTVRGHDPAPWKRAMAACSMCPMLAQCESRLAAGETVREQIMAGRLFTVRGDEIPAEKVDEYALARGRRKKTDKRAAPPTPSPASDPAAPNVARQIPLFGEVAA